MAKFIYFFGVIMSITVLFSGCTAIVQTGSTGSTGSSGSTATTSGASSTPSTAEPQWGVQSKTSGCQINGPLQDTACTPGAIFPNATKADICTPGYARSVRNVPQSVKNKVYAAYGIKRHITGEYEVDHLVSLQLGGSNDISNLWPEAASPKPGFHEKDTVENYVHDQICSGAMSLKQGQIEIATNWLAIYNRMPAKQRSAPSGAENE